MLEEILKKLKLAFLKDKDIIFAYLFGSAVSQKGFNLKSDVDIAVFLDEKRVQDNFEKRLKLMGATEKAISKETEVVILNDIQSIFFKFVILSEGKLIFERDHSLRLEFELKTIRDYFDFKPFIEKYNQAYLKRELSKL